MSLLPDIAFPLSTASHLTDSTRGYAIALQVSLKPLEVGEWVRLTTGATVCVCVCGEGGVISIASLDFKDDLVLQTQTTYTVGPHQ